VDLRRFRTRPGRRGRISLRHSIHGSTSPRPTSGCRYARLTRSSYACSTRISTSWPSPRSAGGSGISCCPGSEVGSWPATRRRWSSRRPSSCGGWARPASSTSRASWARQAGQVRQPEPALAQIIRVVGAHRVGQNGQGVLDMGRPPPESGRQRGAALVWRRPAALIRAEYRTGDGVAHESLLLASGWWGLARHVHYVPEVIVALCRSLPAGSAASFRSARSAARIQP
jgi:Ergosterol biosynthesis ERG4/ERG24 family